jgi:DNA-binding MarR family transcriptional regulator
VVSATEPRLASALRISVMRLSRRMRQERTSGLTQTQIAALATLERHGPLTPGELAGYERVQPPSMTRVIAHLTSAGLVARTAHPNDGRQAVVAVTSAGRALLAADRARRDEWLAGRLATLTPDELELLAKVAPVLDKLAGG